VNNWSRLILKQGCQIKPKILPKTHCKQLIVYDGCWVTQPLAQISGKPLPLPKLPQRISLGSVRIRLNGWAWYGPGFHGSSASGEIYNQNALTAAHRSTFWDKGTSNQHANWSFCGAN